MKKSFVLCLLLALCVSVFALSSFTKNVTGKDLKAISTELTLNQGAKLQSLNQSYFAPRKAQAKSNSTMIVPVDVSGMMYLTSNQIEFASTQEGDGFSFILPDTIEGQLEELACMVFPYYDMAAGPTTVSFDLEANKACTVDVGWFVYNKSDGANGYNPVQVFPFSVAEDGSVNSYPATSYTFEAVLDYPYDQWYNGISFVIRGEGGTIVNARNITLTQELPRDNSIYLRGDINGWNYGDAWRFTTEDNINYTLSGVKLTKGEQFKIADAYWEDVNYGVDANIMNGETYTLVYNDMNCTMGETIENATITFNRETLEMTVSGTVVTIPDAVTSCPYEIPNSNAYLQLDEQTWVGINMDYMAVTGIVSEAETIDLTKPFTYTDWYGSSELYFETFGIDSAFDWSTCPNLKTIYFGKADRYARIYANFDNSSVTDIYMGSTSVGYGSGYIRTDGNPLYIHTPIGTRSNYSAGYWTGAEILVGDEKPGMPAMSRSEYRVDLGDGTFVGVTMGSEGLIVNEIHTSATEFVVPEVLPYGSVDELYYVVQVGNDNSYSDGAYLTKNAPNLKSLSFGTGITYIRINYSYANLKELHFAGDVISSNWGPSSGMVIYVQDANYYDNFVAYYSGRTVIPEGWDFEWLTVNVVNPGEFAQTYLELTGDDWSYGRNVKITGNLGVVDLGNINNLISLMKLDLSETTITGLCQNFLYNRSTLHEVVLPSTLKTINSYAFYNCNSLQSVTFAGDNNVTKIEDEAFNRCHVLTGFELPNVTSIGYGAFQSCENLDIKSAKAATSIGAYAFAYSGITTVDADFFNEAITEIPYNLFYECNNLTSVVLPEGVTKIGSNAFTNCTALTNISLPLSLKEIERYAFSSTAISEITLPDYVNNIHYGVFNYCYNLNTINCKAVAPPTAEGEIMGGVDLTPVSVNVPPFAIDAYRAAEYWSAFYKYYSLLEPVNFMYVDRLVEIDIEEEDNELLTNNPSMIIARNTEKGSIGQLTINGAGTMSASVIDINPYLRRRSYSKNNNYSIPTLINNADKMRTDSISIHFAMDNDYWHFVSLPYDVQVKDIKPSADTYWVIRKYDAAARAAGNSGTTWVDLTEDDVMEAGVGYIVRAYNYNTTPEITFPSRNTTTKNNIFRSTNVIVPLTEIEAEFAHNRSWNFVGNPYPAYFNANELLDNNEEAFTAPITIWRGTSYQAYSPIDDNLIIRPYEAFFVQRPLDKESMVFTTTGRMHFKEAYDASTNGTGAYAPGLNNKEREMTRNVFDFTVSCGEMDNRARIVINEDAELGYEVGRDASKFFTVENGSPLIYVSADQSYEICERPLADGAATLGLQITAEGIYTIALSGRHNSDWEVWLTDTHNGSKVNLCKESYTFNSENSSDPHRFLVNFIGSTCGVASIDAIDPAAEISVANLLGSEIYRGEAAGFECPADGIYLVTLNGTTHKVYIRK